MVRAVLYSSPNKTNHSPHLLGAQSLRVHAQSKGHDVQLVSSDEGIEGVLKHQPDIVGFTVNYANEDHIAPLIKQINVPVVLGGPSVTYMNPDSNVRTLGADYFVRGDGEEAFVQLLESNLAFPGISTKHDYNDVVAQADMSQIPSPFPIPFESDHLYWETSRGCVFKCVYCAHEARKQGFQHIPLERLEQDVVEIAKASPRALYIVDPVLGGKKERTKEVLGLLSSLDDIHISASLRPEYVDEDLAQRLAKANIGWLDFGLQTTNSDLSYFRKNGNLEGLPFLREYGVNFNLDLIVGIPGDSEQSVWDSLSFVVEQAHPNTFRAYRLCVYDGTPLLRMADQHGWTFDEQSREIQDSSFGSAEELTGLMKEITPITHLYRYFAQHNWSGAESFRNVDSLRSIVAKLRTQGHELLDKDQLDFDPELVKDALKEAGV